MVSSTASWRAERSGSLSVTSANENSCNSFSASAGRMSTAMRILHRYGSVLMVLRHFAQPSPVLLHQHRIDRAGGLAFAAFRPAGPCRRHPGEDVEMDPGPRMLDEFAQEQRRGD